MFASLMVEIAGQGFDDGFAGRKQWPPNKYRDNYIMGYKAGVAKREENKYNPLTKTKE